MNFLEIKNLNKSFDKNIRILKDINISVNKGEFVVLLGPSGCGKSTLLNCIAGLIKYEAGEIFIDKKNINDVHPSKRDIAMVFQSYALYPNMNVRNNISFGMKIRKEAKELITQKVNEAANILNITDILDRKPSELSGGQQQRVAIGRALVRSPQTFLFDEPLSNLDAKLRSVMRTEIKRLHRKLGATIIYVTHDQVEAMSLADKIAVLNKGEVVQFGSPNEIYFEPNSTFVADFIGSPAMNIIPATILIRQGEYEFCIHDQESKKDYYFPLPDYIKKGEKLERFRDYCENSKDVLVGIRPENIYFNTDDKSRYQSVNNGSVEHTLPLKVEFIEPVGADNIVITSLSGKEVVCRLHSGLKSPQPGIHHFEIDLEKVIFYSLEQGNKIV